MSWYELRRAEKSCENLRKAEISWDEMRWDDLTGEEWWRAEKSWVETSCVEWRSWEELRREEFRCAEKRWEKRSGDMRRDETSCDQLRDEKREKTWDGLRWDEVKKAEKTWDEMNWAMSNFQEKLRCDEIRWEKIQQYPTFKRHGIRLTSRELVAAQHRKPGSNL